MLTRTSFLVFGVMIGIIAAGVITSFDEGGLSSFSKFLERWQTLAGAIATIAAGVLAWWSLQWQQRRQERVGAVAALALGAEMARMLSIIRHNYASSPRTLTLVPLAWREDGRLELSLRSSPELCRAILLADESFDKWNWHCDGNVWYSAEILALIQADDSAKQRIFDEKCDELLDRIRTLTKEITQRAELASYWERRH